VIDWTASQQVIVFTHSAVPEIRPNVVYSGPEAVRVARLAFGSR